MERITAASARAALRLGLSLILANSILACSDAAEDGSSGSGGAGGTSARGGSQGGVSGASGNGGSAVDVLNPDIPAPSYDCRTDLQTKQCVSIRGTIAGQAIDRYCALPNSPLGFVGNPPAWVTSCEDQEAGQIYVYRVDVLVQEPGSFQHMLDPAAYTGADIVAGVDNAGGDGRSNHLVRAEIAGAVARDPQTDDDIIAGTFRATWGTPTVDCNPRYIEQCAPADVHGTFRIDYALKVGSFP